MIRRREKPLATLLHDTLLVPGASASTALQTQRRRNLLPISVAAAFGLNLLALGAFASAASHWQVAPGGARQTSWITAVQVAQQLPEPVRVVAEVPPRTRPAPPLPQRAVAPPPPTPQETEPEPTAAAHEPTVPTDAAGLIRFYRSAEVDLPADPDSDWNLDPAALDVAGIETLVFDVFVSSEGEVVGCTILEPATLPSEVREGLETRLRQTAVKPAIRGGKSVASVRRIEVSVLPQTP